MGGRVKPEIELKIFCSDTMLNYRLSKKLKLLGNGEFNYSTISLTRPKSGIPIQKLISCLIAFSLQGFP